MFVLSIGLAILVVLRFPIDQTRDITFIITLF